MTVYIPHTIKQRFRKDLQQVLGDIHQFAHLHTVADKDTKKPIPFRPLPMQRKIFEAVQAGHKRIAIIKARQVAATTGAKMVLQHLLYTTPHSAMMALVSMRADSAAVLLRENRRWLEELPKQLQRPLRIGNAGELLLDDTGASIKAFTSRSKTGLRSFQPAAAVVSEFAYAPNQDEVLKQADAAVGDAGLLIIESTAQNPGDRFSQIVRGAPDNGWLCLSMFWHEHPAYTDDRWPDDFPASLSSDERAEQDRYGLSLDQLYWRRRKVLQIGLQNFRVEYPGCLSDCFLRTEGLWFDPAILQRIEPIDATGPQRELEAPNPHDRYVVGVDVGGGVGGDYSAAVVVSVGTLQPVYVYRNNKISPRDWAHEVVRIATRYNGALVLLESNNHGHASLLEIEHCGYRTVWRNPRTGRPWTTTMQSKLEALSTLRDHLEVIERMDRALWMELRSLTLPPGKATPEAPPGNHDDLAMAAALAYRGLADIPPSWRTDGHRSTRARAESLIDKAKARRVHSYGLPF
jgi:hypothetical protein